jgi:hypothetical protein
VNQDELPISRLKRIRINHFVRVMAPSLRVWFFPGAGPLDEIGPHFLTGIYGEWDF